MYLYNPIRKQINQLLYDISCQMELQYSTTIYVLQQNDMFEVFFVLVA